MRSMSDMEDEFAPKNSTMSRKDYVSPQELIIKHLPAHHLFTQAELLCKYLMLFNIYVNLLFSWQTWVKVRKCFIVQPALHLSTFYKTGFKVL